MATKKRTGAKRKLTEYRRKRDFTKTREPAGGTGSAVKAVGARKKRAPVLHFVIQKHDASHLHFDFRLELDGVMKSWAVPKGPSNDPSVRRLAMEVEDHPIEYNKFEGTIPHGEYGGGTVMLWDRGTYEAENGGGVEALRDGYARGDLKFVLDGERLHGGWVLVRMKRPGRPQWGRPRGQGRDVAAVGARAGLRRPLAPAGPGRSGPALRAGGDRARGEPAGGRADGRR